MDTSVFMSALQSSYTTVLPVVVFTVFTLLLIPSLMVPGAKADQVMKAIACYMMKTIGMLCIAASMMPLTYNLIANTIPPMTTVNALLVVFLVGVGILVHFSRTVSTVDAASAMVPRLVFSHGFELIGMVVVLVSGLSLMLTFMLTQRFDGWQMSGTTLLLGMLLMLTFSMHISLKKTGMKVTKVGARKK